MANDFDGQRAVKHPPGSHSSTHHQHNSQQSSHAALQSAVRTNNASAADQLLAPRPVRDNATAPFGASANSHSQHTKARRVPIPVNLGTSSKSDSRSTSTLQSSNVARKSSTQTGRHRLAPPSPMSTSLQAKSSADFAADTNGLYGSPIAEEDEDIYDQNHDVLDNYSSSPSPPSSPPPSTLFSVPTKSTQHPGDPAQILQQMRQLAGGIRGNVLFRTIEKSPWTKCYAYLNPDTGDFCQRPPHESQYTTIITDLRKCQAQAIHDTMDGHRTILVRPRDQSAYLFLRPEDFRLFDNWFAVCLSWSCIAPKQALHGGAGEYRLTPVADMSEAHKAAAARSVSSTAPTTIKSGDAVLVEFEAEKSGARRLAKHRVLCVIRSDGRLSIRGFEARDMITSVDVASLPRSAIQRLHPSALGLEFAIAIYPHYAQSRVSYRVRPIQLTFETREIFETWLIMLRAIAKPEFFGSQRLQSIPSLNGQETLPGLRSTESSVFRLEHHIDLRITRLKLKRGSIAPDQDQEKRPSVISTAPDLNSIVIEVCLDEHLKGKTAPRSSRSEMFWDVKFCFEDTSSRISTMTLRIMEHHRNTGSSYSLGDVTVDLNDALLAENFEGNLPVLDSTGNSVGEVSLELKHGTETILLEHEYDQLAKLLDSHKNDLTVMITQRLSPSLLSSLAQYFLNIYQASNSVENWLRSLIEHELGGPRNSSFTRPSSADVNTLTKVQSGTIDTAPNSPMQSSFGIAEAVLLFRGNTLLTKALELYMKRIGRNYLESTLGDKLRELSQTTENYEVDPNRLPQDQDTRASWTKLIQLTTDFWVLISNSARQCPAEMSTLFRHVRTCARRRFGPSVPSVDYTSVSGFLFLRYFCAAILGPQLFGLLDDSLSITPQASRAFMLIAKSLQGLANLSTFGNKEPWMAPMNSFCSSNRQSFKNFIDAVCAGSSHDDQLTSRTGERLSSNAMASLEIIDKLPPLAREGFPSFPDLIDGPRNYARLVSLWSNHLESGSPGTSSSSRPSRASVSTAFPSVEAGDLLSRFDSACRALRQRTLDVTYRADKGKERVNPAITLKWIALAEEMELCPDRFWLQSGTFQGRPLTEPQREQRFDSVISDTATELAQVKSADHIEEAPKASKFLAFGWDTSRDKKDKKSKKAGEAQGQDPCSRKQSAASQTEMQSPRAGRPSSTRSNDSGASKAMTTKSGRRKKSPPRTADQNAMRKLGLI